jgi:hypothetical protein
MSGCAAGGLIYSSTVRVPLIKRCVLRHGAKVQSSTVLVHWLWLVAAKRPLAYEPPEATEDSVTSEPLAQQQPALEGNLPTTEEEETGTTTEHYGSSASTRHGRRRYHEGEDH